MKSDRRHELQQNDLAIYLGRINTAIEPYSKLIAGVLVVVFVGALVAGYYSTTKNEERSEATRDLIQAAGKNDAEELLRVSDEFSGTIAGEWAKLYQGQVYLIQGIQALYDDRTDAEELLSDATKALEAAAADSKDTLLKSRAQFGIARAAESLGNIDDAVKAYEQVVAINESEAMVKKANDRIETLANPQTTDFLAWFSEQNFSSLAPNFDPSLPPSTALPGLPDVGLPPLNFGPASDAEPRDLDGGIELPAEGEPAAEPAAEGNLDLPADGTPADGPADAPAETSGAPAEETETPADDTDSPADDTDSPADEAEVPADEANSDQ